MAYVNGPKIISDGLTILFDGANNKFTNRTDTLYNLVSNSFFPSISLFYGSTVYGNFVSDGTIFLDGLNDSSTSGNFLYTTGNLSSTINNAPFTTACWVKRTANKKATICEYRGASFRLEFAIDSTTVYFAQRLAVSPFTTTTTSVNVSNALNVWNYYALSRSDSNWSFYKDGVLLGTNTFTQSEAIGTGNSISIGIAWSDDDFQSRGMTGFVGPWYHYNRALSEQEIIQNYNATRSRFGV
jgi:hypothetical protein